MLEWLPFPTPGDLPDPGIESVSPAALGRPPSGRERGSCLSVVRAFLTVVASVVVERKLSSCGPRT